jgi:hypothetical protein
VDLPRRADVGVHVPLERDWCRNMAMRLRAVSSNSACLPSLVRIEQMRLDLGELGRHGKTNTGRCGISRCAVSRRAQRRSVRVTLIGMRR